MSDARRDEKAYSDWLEIEGINYAGPHHLAWWAACAYKDKRIAQLEKAFRDLQDISAEKSSMIESGIKRIAELEAKLSDINIMLDGSTWVYGASLANDNKRLVILNLIG